MATNNNQDNKPICGSCATVISDLEPTRCGLCENYFHTTVSCAGFTARTNLCSQGKAVFICAGCRTELKGRSLREYFVGRIQDSEVVPQPQSSVEELSKQVQTLASLVESLTEKVAKLMSPPPVTMPNDAVVDLNHFTPVVERRRENRWRPDRSIKRAPIGTRPIDLSDLSVSVIAAKPSSSKFWLYLTGFDPRITDADMKIIISRCLEQEDVSPDIVRLVAKGMSTDQLTFISFKIGLDPEMREKALEDVWPNGIGYREFIEAPKNFRRPTNHAGGDDIRN